ncbi:AMP-dependent synthetase and ligase family protein [Canna indica]|uniref:AMP-dependent synthetase and ligase family protein n=1 Tax=Canna indica TaxID=4628 RepID=A0AAQ3KXG5_9LILI|nr:AMP-dependent synthetase and ligase family protein [Canna indica]
MDKRGRASQKIPARIGTSILTEVLGIGRVGLPAVPKAVKILLAISVEATLMFSWAEAIVENLLFSFDTFEEFHPQLAKALNNKVVASEWRGIELATELRRGVMITHGNVVAIAAGVMSVIPKLYRTW